MLQARIRLLMVLALGASLALVAIVIGGSSPSSAANGAVTITDDSFSPKSYAPNPITVQAGDSVTWTNNGPATHTVTSDPGGALAFDSGNIAAGGTFTQTFSTAGTFTYHCSIHPGMTGSVIVQAAASGGATPAASGASPTVPAGGASPTPATRASSPTPVAGVAGATTSSALPSTGSGPSHGGGGSMWLLVAGALGAAGALALGVRFLFPARR
ncbi:MAG TPA: plastocyanin/azurin family copper-binding protein [Dehalococcoidia bacterium]|nr:plastocyanin/azurin family copper-binding protein [Dehalococcoidia bacterium]